MDDKGYQLLKKWTEAKDALMEIDQKRDPIAAAELELRRAVVSALFTHPEGTENLELANNWKLKATIKLDRKVDEASLPAIEIALRAMSVNTETLIRRKPEVVIKQYRELTEEQRKVFDQALIIKPGAPTLELVPPKGE